MPTRRGTRAAFAFWWEFLGTRIVDYESATRFIARGDRFRPVEVDADHFEIAKPRKFEDEDGVSYDTVYSAFRDAYAALDIYDPARQVAAIQSGGPMGENQEDLLKVSLAVDQQDGVVPFALTATVLPDLGPEATYRWFLGTKELPSNQASTVLELTESSAAYLLRVIVSARGVKEEKTMALQAHEPPRSSRTQTVVANIGTGKNDVERVAGDNEIDSDDWSKLKVSYSSRLVDSGRALEVTLTWDAFELEGDRSFERGNTRFRSTTTAVVWRAGTPHERAVAILSGGSGSAEYYVKGKCTGPRTYAPVGGIARPKITFDAKVERTTARRHSSETLS